MNHASLPTLFLLKGRLWVTCILAINQLPMNGYNIQLTVTGKTVALQFTFYDLIVNFILFILEIRKAFRL